MPGKESIFSTAVIESPVLGSLKAHKTLSRKDVETRSRDLVQKPTINQGESTENMKKRNRRTYMTDEGIRTWIPDASQRESAPAVAKPLTPPINLRDTFKSWIDDDALKVKSFAHGTVSPEVTPLIQQSPPTPKTTPPRKVHKSSLVDSLYTTNTLKHSEADPSERRTESRTDSFKTARENASSDDEFYSEDSPSLNPSRQRWLRDTGMSKSGGIGLGLGLESDEDEPLHTPKLTSYHGPSEQAQKFITFDGVWGSSSTSGPDDTESQTTVLRAPEEKALHESSTDPERNGGELPLVGAHNSRRSGEKTHRKIPSTENEGRLRPKWATEESDQPYESDPFSDFEIQEVNSKRLSQISNTSTVVEALVIDSTPQRRRTLRHTGKIVGFDTTPSNRSSSKSTEVSVQHRLRNARSPSHELRKTFISDLVNDHASRSVDSKTDRQLVTVIPDRRASLQSSIVSSKRISRTFSINSQQYSSRPTTAPEDTVGYFDVPRPGRTVSVVLQQAKPLKTDSLAEKTLSSPITTDNPPTATLASRDLSRTTSTTSGGLRTHYIPQTPSSAGTPQPTDPHETQLVSVQRSNSGDWTAVRPRSALVTPFSLRSMHSSTPGTLEVNEATAVNIYPHTNESILVIQEMAGKDVLFPTEQSTIIAGNASIALPGPVTPREPQESMPQRVNTNSPLQNPRNPPIPPNFNVIPPTPANAASSSDSTVENARPSRKRDRLSGPLSSLRRAMSARRYSESITQPLGRTFSLRSSSSRRRPQTAGDENGRLHPLWRPRTFWDGDGGSDSDSEFGNDGILPPRRSASYNAPKRSLSLTRKLTGPLRHTSEPHAKRASISSHSKMPSYSAHAYAESHDIPKRTSSLTGRFGGSLRLPGTRRPKKFSTGEWHDQPHYEFVRPDATTADEVPPHGYPVQFVGLRGLAERLERRRESREEGKREARRDWLRERIGLVGPRDFPDFTIVHPQRRSTRD